MAVEKIRESVSNVQVDGENCEGFEELQCPD